VSDDLQWHIISVLAGVPLHLPTSHNTDCCTRATCHVRRFDDGKALPSAPAGTEYRFDMGKQLWVATDKTTFQQVPGGELRDGVKYLLGVKFLPTGESLP
jgi:hypothetical protein